jgi:hypothetical protein
MGWVTPLTGLSSFILTLVIFALGSAASTRRGSAAVATDAAASDLPPAT